MRLRVGGASGEEGRAGEGKEEGQIGEGPEKARPVGFKELERADMLVYKNQSLLHCDTTPFYPSSLFFMN